MSLSVAEQERLLEAVYESLLAFIYDDLSGIPEIRQRLEAQGLKLTIGVETGIESDNPPSQPSPPTSTEDDLDEWRNMGISLEDLREVAQTETRRSEEAIKVLIEQIRNVSSSLSSRGRNYSWGWLHVHYPEIGLGQNPATVHDERFALLAIPVYWQNIIETVLRAVSIRRDKKEVLSRFLTTLNFAKANT
jgi:hypothetical protein